MITYTLDQATVLSSTNTAAIISGTLTVAAGDFITLMLVCEDNAAQTAWTLSNTGSAITWTLQKDTNTASNTRCLLWTGTAGATPPTTITVTATAGASTMNCCRLLATAAHTGAHVATPLPAGNIFSGAGGHNVSQSITPTASGSALWFICGDWSQTNTFAAIANCTLGTVLNEASRMTAAYVQPTTQPRPDGLPFTIGETDAGGKIAWIAFEVQAQPPLFISSLLDVGIQQPILVGFAS